MAPLKNHRKTAPGVFPASFKLYNNMAHLRISTPGEAAKIVRAGKLAAVRPEDLQTFGHIYGRAYSFRGSAIHPINGRYYIIAKYPIYR